MSGDGVSKRGPKFKPPGTGREFAVHARLSPEAHAKLARLALAASGGRRGGVTAALEAAILAAPEPPNP